MRDKGINQLAESKIDIDFNSFIGYKKIQIKENNEEICDIQNYELSGENYYYSLNNPPYNMSIPHAIPGLYMRKTVLEKLEKINKELRSIGIELYIYDGYRPLLVQIYIYNEWLYKYYSNQFPDMTENEIRNIISKYWAKPPNSFREINLDCLPPHLTGGAVDLTLRYVESKRLLEMGGMFDDLAECSDIDYYEKQENFSKSMTFVTAKRNRRILFNVMTNNGFAYHPNEWWHYSYGDQNWAHQYKKQFALYGGIER